MRVPAGLSWAAIATEVSLASSQALIYTSEALKPQSNGDPPSISPNTARLLLSHRLGISQFDSLGDADDSILEILSSFGGQQPQVFGSEEHPWGNERLLLLVEGVSNPKDIFGSSISPALSIYDVPSLSHNEELLSNLLEQDQHSRSAESHFDFRRLDFPGVRGGFSASHISPESLGQLNVFASKTAQLSDLIDLHKSTGMSGHEHTMILHATTLLGLKPKDGERYTTALSDLKAFIDYFHKRNGRISSTIVLMPATTKVAKRSSTSPYGTLNKPLSVRQQQAEEPLSTPASPSANKPSAPETLQASTFPLPHGILPICHPTLDSAIATTNNCSGHGTAYKKVGGDTDCYACKCEKTVLTVDGGGSKTIYWGGPACQKKDISVPFFLLAGLSIALVGAVTWGIGLMASIGQEELPSVIGSGVTGPRAQK